MAVSGGGAAAKDNQGAKMLRRIGLEQLRTGMFIEAFEGSWLGGPLAGHRFMLQTEEETVGLKESKVSGMFINTAKGSDVSQALARPGGAAIMDRASKTSAVSRERKIRMITADKIKRTSDLLKGIFEDVGGGAAVTVAMVAPVIEEISQSLDINPSIFINMTRLKSRDEATFLHSLAVAALMIRLARHLKLKPGMVPMLGISGLLHDIGKIGMPIEVLTKGGSLSDSEMELIRRHPALGHHMLSRGQGMPDVVLDVCLHHHERLDGKGYPMRLVEGQISLYARMAAICDVYDALTSVRPYKKAWTSSEAVSWMFGTTGVFDRRLLHQFVDGVILEGGSFVGGDVKVPNFGDRAPR